MPLVGQVWTKWWVGFLLLLLLAGGSLYVSNRFAGALADTSPAGLSQLRDTLLADPASVSGHWLRTLNPLVKDVQGDLVWNSQQQQGVMRIRDLPDPKNGNFYQLWLYDARGASGEPVSGAVLHKGAGREDLYALIVTDVPVLEPYKFVLKREKEKGTGSGQVLLMVQP